MTHQIVLFGLELVHFHEFEEGEESDDEVKDDDPPAQSLGEGDQGPRRPPTKIRPDRLLACPSGSSFHRVFLVQTACIDGSAGPSQGDAAEQPLDPAWASVPPVVPVQVAAASVVLSESNVDVTVGDVRRVSVRLAAAATAGLHTFMVVLDAEDDEGRRVDAPLASANANARF